MATPLTITLDLNGTPTTISVQDGAEDLLYVLRNKCNLNGPKFGCGVAQCGSCTVLVNGAIKRSCVVPLTAMANNDQVQTLEGFTAEGDQRTSSAGSEDDRRIETDTPWAPKHDISRTDGKHKKAFGAAFQRAFVSQQAAQCGYCANAMIMGAGGWLQNRISSGNTAIPTPDEIKNFLSGVGQTPPFVYLCRCGTHLRIIRAIEQAAAEVLA